MSNVLYQLVYYSRNEVAGDKIEFEAAVSDILAASRHNNGLSDITGALLFNGGCFAQVLEGSLAAVEETFERIQQDPRHGDVSLLALEPINERSFSDWAMGFVGQSAKNATLFSKIGLASGFDPRQLGNKEIHRILKDIILSEEKAAV